MLSSDLLGRLTETVEPDIDRFYIRHTPHDHHMCASYYHRAKPGSPFAARRKGSTSRRGISTCNAPTQRIRDPRCFPGMCAAHDRITLWAPPTQTQPLRVKRGLRWRAELALPWVRTTKFPYFSRWRGPGHDAIPTKKAIWTGQQPRQLATAPSLTGVSELTGSLVGMPHRHRHGIIQKTRPFRHAKSTEQRFWTPTDDNSNSGVR